MCLSLVKLLTLLNADTGSSLNLVEVLALAHSLSLLLWPDRGRSPGRERGNNLRVTTDRGVEQRGCK